MSDQHGNKVIISTPAHHMLTSAVDVVVHTAGLGIVKGPVGIGKTFAFNEIAADLAQNGVEVVMITCAPEIEGSVRSLCQAVS